MATKTCINPSCKKENPPEKIHCKFCGWKLPIALPPEKLQPKVGSDGEPNPDSKELGRTVDPKPASIIASPLETNEVLATVPIGDHQLLVQAHQALTAENEQLKQDHQNVLKNNQGLSGRLVTMEQAAARIPGLEQALAAAKVELDRIRSQPATLPGGPDTAKPPSRALTWGLPVVALVAGLFAGVHSPLNTYKSQVDQTRSQLRATLQQLNSTNAQRKEALQANHAAQEKNGQLANQLASQVAQQSQASQSNSVQLGVAQGDLAATKASLARTTADLEQMRRQKEVSDQRLAQALAEGTRKASQLEAVQSVVSKHPLLNYKGPTEGNFTISYNARNDKPTNITVDHQRVSGDGGLSISTITGSMLPGVPVVVQPVGSRHALIVDSPGPGNGWARLTLRVEGKDQHQASVHWSVPQ